MTAPTPQDVAAFLGRAEAPATVPAEQSLTIVTAMVKAYTRGAGFDTFGEPASDLAAVILSSAARLAANTEHARADTSGPFSHTYGRFDAWTLPELAVLNRYRRRAL